ncbi:MAG: acyl-CoA dehydratase activase [Candidatus Omnitrophica bacterium]|nr:acyl-CoA dehydratase activase [Candidatus Omnitrophota bacterium]
MKTLGICLGASTITIAEVTNDGGISARLLFSRRHEGNLSGILLETLSKLPIKEYEALAVTGRKLCRFLNLSIITEPEATEGAVEYLWGRGTHFDALVSCGGETFMVYMLDKAGKISRVHTGNKCASGTGEFFLQQIRRMNITVEEALALAYEREPFKVSGRCSVFCKSDCTHALNHGKPIGDVVAGLCEMMSTKITELLHNVPKNKIAIVGGVSRNPIVMEFLKRYVPDIIVPKEACFFEALGAALWAQHNKCKSFDLHNIFKKQSSSFSFLPPLKDAMPLVSFKQLPQKHGKENDECVVGLDVGSTTTKAVLMRLEDDAIIASVYLRTNGQPIEASRNCYRKLMQALAHGVSVVGLGVTGSGRHIAGLHALTKDIINEIIAHARAAVYFDKDVDTIFEIGGQDAKYTYLVNGVPCDYAMNEACSAGTGSFLEESCKETLGVDTEEIAAIALKSKFSPNFSDQCAAFISSDIKTAMHEGIAKENIIAGLVYSVCMNYINRVKGSRPAGKKIFMQGGVCYNQAVPLAMAAFIKRDIIVPPNPGLMGAFGVAQEVKERMNLGVSKKEKFDLKTLAEREVEYGRAFICPGNSEGCDRKCAITNIKLEGKSYPFGGACNKYYNIRFDLRYDAAKNDLVALRNKELLRGYGAGKHEGALAKTIGLNLSFLTHSLFPLYFNFFKTLGLRILLPDKIMHEGIKFQGAAFCYPAALAHGLFFELIHKKPDYLFLPHVTEMYVKNAVSTDPEHQSTCLILQAEPYYLKTAFKNYLPASGKIINPVLNFSKGFSAARPAFLRIARRLGKSKKSAKVAYHNACLAQDEFVARLKKSGEELLEKLKNNPEEIAVVIFGRPYNAFCTDMNLGIPGKFTSRGINVIPFDFLPYESSGYKGPAELYGRDLTWAFGQMILKAASFVQQYPQLFGVYITNFSCGPDSFLLTYFREIMKDKPSLTIEIDSHTADAGVNTRVEAFLDIVQRYRHLKKLNIHFQASLVTGFSPACVSYTNKKAKVISSDNKVYSIFDSRIKLLIPSMGDLGSEVLAAAFNRVGVNAAAMKVSDNEALKYGRAYSSGKECLPLILTCGGLMQYLESHKDEDEVLVYFMPTVGGNCRFSQYNVYIQNLIIKNRLRNVTLFSLSSENCYMGLGNKFTVTALKAEIIADVMDDIRNTLLVVAQDKEYAEEVFRHEWHKIIHNIKSPKYGPIERQLMHAALSLKKIPLKYPIREAKFVSLLGEIFIRKELFSRQSIVERLLQREIIPKAAPVMEWLYYVDYLIKKGIIASDFNFKSKTEFYIKNSLQRVFERRIKTILSRSGLYTYHPIDIKNLVRHGEELVPLELTGEPIVVIGAALSEVLHSTCGVISIGPFNCLPTRVTEAVLTREMNIKGLPFLSIEVDGNPLSPVNEARLEAFCLQSERTHRLMQGNKGKERQDALR